VGAFTGAVVGLYLAFSPATPAWWSGFVVGSVVAASVGFLWWLLYEQDGGRGLRMGNWTERETTSILKKRRDWRVFWPVAFEGMDVDQVAIGPTGVFVFETKHTSVEWRLGPEGLYSPKCDPLSQARKSANKIRLLLKHTGGVTCDPVPVLVVWGPLSSYEEGPVSVDGVQVVAARHLRRWTKSAQGKPLSHKEVDLAVAVVDGYLHRLDLAA
jgi:hypothetical protein